MLEGTREYDIQGRRTGPNAAYCTSKLANVLFGMQLSEKLAVSYNFRKIFKPIFIFLFLKNQRIRVLTSTLFVLDGTTLKYSLSIF